MKTIDGNARSWELMNLLKNNVKAKEMAEGLGVHTAPAVGMNLVSSAHIGWLTATYSCSSWGFSASCLCEHLHSCVYPHIHIMTNSS